MSHRFHALSISKMPNAALVNVQLLTRRTEVEVCIVARQMVSGSSSRHRRCVQSSSAGTKAPLRTTQGCSTLLQICSHQGRGNEKLRQLSLTYGFMHSETSLCPVQAKHVEPADQFNRLSFLGLKIKITSVLLEIKSRLSLDRRVERDV